MVLYHPVVWAFDTLQKTKEFRKVLHRWVPGLYLIMGAYMSSSAAENLKKLDATFNEP